MMSVRPLMQTQDCSRYDTHKGVDFLQHRLKVEDLIKINLQDAMPLVCDRYYLNVGSYLGLEVPVVRLE